MSRIKILGIDIDVLTVKETIDEVEKYIINKKPLHLMGVNADKINLCQTNQRLKDIVNNCDIINADGASVVLASKYLKRTLPERVAGIDLMMDLVALSEEKGYSIYLLGAKEEIVHKTADVIKNKHPKIDIVGVRNGYFSDDEWDNIQKDIDEKNPDIVFVGITSPKKEYLVDYFQKNGSIPVYMGVGGSFDVISGTLKRAPLWMQKCNLEWLFRVSQEPKRLFKRYFVGNGKFIIDIIREKSRGVA